MFKKFQTIFFVLGFILLFAFPSNSYASELTITHAYKDTTNIVDFSPANWPSTSTCYIGTSYGNDDVLSAATPRTTCNNGHLEFTQTVNTSTTYYLIVCGSGDNACIPSDATTSGFQFTLPPTPTPTPTLTPQIVANPSTATVTEGTPFTVDIVVDGAGTPFNAAQANLSFDNLTVNNLFLHPSSNACDFHYTITPTSSDPSFAGAIFGTSTVTSCKVYTLSLIPTSAGTGTISITNAHIKAYSNSLELISNPAQPNVNVIFTIDAASPTPTPTIPLSQLTITSPSKIPWYTYKSSYMLEGGYQSPITAVLINNEEADLESGTWQKQEDLQLDEGYREYDNTFTIYGTYGSNQTATQVIDIKRHKLADIDGNGVVDLIDASMFAQDWGKDDQHDFTYILSDMNETPDNVINLTDFSILAKAYEQ